MTITAVTTKLSHSLLPPSAARPKRSTKSSNQSPRRRGKWKRTGADKQVDIALQPNPASSDQCAAANTSHTTKGAVPCAATNSDADTTIVKTVLPVPVALTNGDGAAVVSTQPNLGYPAVSTSIQVLRELVRLRRVWMLRISSNRRRLEGECRAFLGYNPMEAKTEKAKRIVDDTKQLCAFLCGKKKNKKPVEPPDVPQAIIDRMVMLYAPLAPFLKECERHKRELERQISSEVHSLPIWGAWAANQPGVGEITIGLIVGSCGDIGGYRSKGALWLRMGLGTFDGRPQGKPGPNATPEDWIRHGYNKERRAIMHNVGTSLLCALHPLYKRVFDQQKELELGRTKTRLHAQMRALRYTEKLFLKHLWQKWKESTPQPTVQR